MKRIICMLTAFTALIVWSTPVIAQVEKQDVKQEVEKRTVVAYTGKVLRVDRGDPAMVVVKTDKTEMNVELAPMSFVESSKLTLAPDSVVAVRGYQTIRDGKAVFVATEVTSQGNVVKLRDADFKPLWTVKSGGGGKARRTHLHSHGQGQELPDRGPGGRRHRDRQGTDHDRARPDDVHRTEQARSRAE